MVVSPDWVAANGGAENVRIIRVDPETGTNQVLETKLTGYDSQGRAIFQALSPDGLSVFGLVSLAKNPEVPLTPAPTISPAMTTATPDATQSPVIIEEPVSLNIVLIIGILILVVIVILILVLRRRSRKQEK